jgi:Ca2+-binding RTX toxin-like protein
MRVPRFLAVVPMLAATFWPASPVHALDPPPNDLFDDATEIAALPFDDQVDTTHATTGEPEDFAVKDACDSPPFDSPEPPDATVWYSLTVAEPNFVLVSAAPPQFVTPGFNVVADHGDHFECVAGGPVEVVFVAEPGVQYFIQSIDDQIPPGFPDVPLDTVNGGILDLSVQSLGVPEPEICPGLIPNDPSNPFPPGLNRVFGTPGDDVLVGTPGPDLIIGLEGDDVMNGLGGDDVLVGCAGDDEISGGDGDDLIVGDSPNFFGNPGSTDGGDDTVAGGPGNDEILGGPGDDDLAGNSGDDAIFANQGNDTVAGNSGADFVVGGFGNDTVTGGSGDDGVAGGPGDDDLNGGQGDDFITGDFPNGQPDPGPNTDHCNGAQGEDTIIFCEAGNGK